MIHEVYEEGAAARDGRLWAGDQILEVNESLRVYVLAYVCVVKVSCRGKKDHGAGSLLEASFLSLGTS